MNHLVLGHLIERLEMRNLEGVDRLNGERERLVASADAALCLQPLARRTERAQDLRPIESLAFTVLAEAHGDPRLPGAAAEPRPSVIYFAHGHRFG